MKIGSIKKCINCFCFITLLLPIVSCIFVFNYFSKATHKSGWFSQNKVYCKKEKNTNDDNGLFLILSNKESLAFSDYTFRDFGIDQEAILLDLTSGYKAIIGDSNYKKLDLFKRIFKVTFPNKKNRDNYFEKKNKPFFVEHVEKCSDARGTFYSTYPSEKFNNYSEYSNQYYLDVINAPQAWDVQTGSPNVVIGLLDTGVNSSHYELSNGQISSNLSSTFNGTNSLPTADLNGHGTFNAGIIGATTNINNNGMAGICWNITIASLRADNPYNYLYDERVEDVVAAINYATTKSIKIVNYSGGFDTESLTLKQAILDYNGLLIVACGNSGYDLNSHPTYPSNWNLSNVLSVGATDQNNSRASFSNYSSSFVDLFAPGVDIRSLYNSSPYFLTDSGTSYSAPMVSAVAGLLLSEYPSMDTKSLKKSIVDNVTYVSALSNYCKTSGILNAYAALSNPHYHSHIDHFVYSNSLKHKAYCVCGDYIMETHMWDFGNTWMVGSKMYGTCFHCGGGFPLT